jgi:hypothetical protein
LLALILVALLIVLALQVVTLFVVKLDPIELGTTTDGPDVFFGNVGIDFTSL